MAYVSPEKKHQIAAALVAVVPADWKYSLAVRHRSTIVMSLTQAPFDLLGKLRLEGDNDPELRRARVLEAQSSGHRVTDLARVGEAFSGLDRSLLETFEKIRIALDTGNHDQSDVIGDYFDVGHYVTFQIGRADRPFVCTAPEMREVQRPPANPWHAARAYFGLDESFLYQAWQITEYCNLYRAARCDPAQIEPVTWVEVVSELGLLEEDPTRYSEAEIRVHTTEVQERCDTRDWIGVMHDFGLDESFQYSRAQKQDYLRHFRTGVCEGRSADPSHLADQPLGVQTTQDEDGYQVTSASIPEDRLALLLAGRPVLQARNQHGLLLDLWLDMDQETLIAEPAEGERGDTDSPTADIEPETPPAPRG